MLVNMDEIYKKIYETIEKGGYDNGITTKLSNLNDQCSIINIWFKYKQKHRPLCKISLHDDNGEGPMLTIDTDWHNGYVDMSMTSYTPLIRALCEVIKSNDEYYKDITVGNIMTYSNKGGVPKSKNFEDKNWIPEYEMQEVEDYWKISDKFYL